MRGHPITRAILVLHRYLGVAVGLLMTIWCLSGFVMMYQAYPTLTNEERLSGLEPLNLAACCDVSKIRLSDDKPISAFRVEMMGPDPVLRLSPERTRGAQAERRGRGGGEAYNLRTGERVQALTDAQVFDIARRHAVNTGIAGQPRSLGVVDTDQWTIQTARRNKPVHHFRFDDPKATEIYVSGSSGEVFQQTTRRERVLAWLGVIPHWIYPTVLRENGPLWTQVVIWTSVVGTFLTATGLYVGISRFKKRKNGRWSPFRGWWYWHHMIGLVFGVLTLTWVFSGLMTMNPWGLLEGARSPVSRQFVSTASWGEVRAFLAAAPAAELPGDLRQLKATPFGDRLFISAIDADGEAVRLDAAGRRAPLREAEVARLVHGLGVPVAEFALMTREDEYHYSHHRQVELPVYRAILGDADRTRLYISARDGNLIRAMGPEARQSRWVRNGLHGLDFAVLRSRPLWYVAVGLLLAGVTAVCITGFWMSLQRVGRDASSARSWLGRLVRSRPAAGTAGKPSPTA